MCPQTEQWIHSRILPVTSSSLSTRKVGARELSRKGDGFGRAVHTMKWYAQWRPCGCAKDSKGPQWRLLLWRYNRAGVRFEGGPKFLHVQEHRLESLWGPGHTLPPQLLTWENARRVHLEACCWQVYAKLLDSVILQKHYYLSLEGTWLSTLKGGFVRQTFRHWTGKGRVRENKAGDWEGEREKEE